MLFYSFSVFFYSVCTFSVCIGGNKDLLKLVLLHETKDLLHCSFEAGHIFSVPPDEVLPTQVDSQVRASLSTAQPVLVQEFTKGHATNMTALPHWNERGCKAHGKHSRNALSWREQKLWRSSNPSSCCINTSLTISIMLVAMTPVLSVFEQWEERINASETYFHLGPVFVVRRLVLFVCGVEILGPKLVSYDTQVFGKHHTSPCL